MGVGGVLSGRVGLEGVPMHDEKEKRKEGWYLVCEGDWNVSKYWHKPPQNTPQRITRCPSYQKQKRWIP